MVKTQNETYIKQGFLLVQQKSSQPCKALESLQIPQLPPPLKWCFLSGSVQFFLYTLLFFVSLLISYLWRGQHWGIFQYCCGGFFSTIVCSWSLSLNMSVQVRAGTACQGEGHCRVAVREGSCQQRLHESDWHFSDTPLGSDWLYWSLERWPLANQIRATGRTHRQWIITPLTCILFYC